MENWGLVTFRETALLWKETISSAYDKMRVASVVAHELAHMWTGNLVTCKWWSDLWINECKIIHPYFELLINFLFIQRLLVSWNGFLSTYLNQNGTTRNCSLRPTQFLP